MVLFRPEIEVRRMIDTYCKPVRAGSRITCNPPPDDTDEDWIIWIERPIQEVDKRLIGLGFELGGSIIRNTEKDWKESTFFSYTKGDLNLIITPSEEFFDKFLEATKLAKQINIIRKENRIKLFQCILYDRKIKAEFT